MKARLIINLVALFFINLSNTHASSAHSREHLQNDAEGDVSRSPSLAITLTSTEAFHSSPPSSLQPVHADPEGDPKSDKENTERRLCLWIPGSDDDLTKSNPELLSPYANGKAKTAPVTPHHQIGEKIEIALACLSTYHRPCSADDSQDRSTCGFTFLAGDSQDGITYSCPFDTQKRNGFGEL